MATKRSAEKSKEIPELVIEAACLQLAGLNSVIKFWASCAEAADKYTQAISNELAMVREGGAESNEIVGRLADLNREYFRELSELPNAALELFNNEINKLAKPKGSRTRAARVKD